MSNIVIINVDMVYDISLMIWKCEVNVWTHGCLAWLYDIKSVIYYNPQLFIFSVLLIYSFSFTQTIFFFENCQVQNGCQSNPIQRCEEQSLSSDVMYSMLLYSHCVPIYALISVQICNFQSVYWYECKGLTAYTKQNIWYTTVYLRKHFSSGSKYLLVRTCLFSSFQILEFDTPAALLADDNSRFRAMIEASNGKLSDTEQWTESNGYKLALIKRGNTAEDMTCTNFEDYHPAMERVRCYFRRH